MANLEYEKEFYKDKLYRVLGMDEAGRGPLAGPLVVAGVILPKDYINEEINDSKKLTSKKREAMAFVDIVDETGNLSLVIMPDLYRIFESELQEDRFIYFEGKIEKEDSCLVKKINIIKEEEA